MNTDTFTAHCEATMPSPEEMAKRVEKQRKATRDIQRANLNAQDARDKLAQSARVPMPKPKAFKPVKPPRPAETIMRGLERKAYPSFKFETFRSFMAQTADRPS